MYRPPRLLLSPAPSLLAAERRLGPLSGRIVCLLVDQGCGLGERGGAGPGYHPDTLATRGNLALWRGEAGDPAGAAAVLEELLADQLRVLGPDHPDTLLTRRNLAFWRGKARGPGGRR